MAEGSPQRALSGQFKNKDRVTFVSDYQSKGTGKDENGESQEDA